MSLVLSNLDFSRAPARDIEIIRGPVLRASSRAGKRYANSKPAQAPQEEDEAGIPATEPSGAPPEKPGEGVHGDARALVSRGGTR